MPHYNEDVEHRCYWPSEPRPFEGVLYKRIRVSLAGVVPELSRRQETPRISPKSSPPCLYLGPSGHSIPGWLSFFSRNPRNVASLDSHILMGCFSAPTLTTLGGFQKTLNLITNPYYSLPSPQYSWQGLDTDISSWKIMHCQVGKLQAVISNTCIRYFKHETLHRLDINLYNGDWKG